ncbi:MAG: efflux RND transporter periplasmic adaptor subunit [Rickettsiales bacterium]
MSRPLIKIVIAVFVIIASYYAYSRFFASGGDMMAGQNMGPTPVDVASVIKRNLRPWNEFSGKLASVDYVEIRPQVSGEIESVHFKDGSDVKEGDLLFTIDPRPFEANLKSAEAAFSLAKAELARAQSLLKSKDISKSNYDQRKNSFLTSEAAVIRARLDLEYSKITAPVSGRISRAEITEGNIVNSTPNPSLLATIASYSPIYAEFDMDEKNFIDYVELGATANEAAAQIPVLLEIGNIKIKGRIASFDNKIDVVSGTVRVRAIFDNSDGKLVPGMFARVKVGEAKKRDLLLISDRAIGTDQDKKFVYVISDDNKAHKRYVTLGSMVDDLRIISKGLKQGEKIVVSGIQRIRMPEQPVQPTVVNMGGGKPDSKGDTKDKTASKD